MFCLTARMRTKEEPTKTPPMGASSCLCVWGWFKGTAESDGFFLTQAAASPENRGGHSWQCYLYPLALYFPPTPRSSFDTGKEEGACDFEPEAFWGLMFLPACWLARG